MTSKLIQCLEEHARCRPDALAVREIGESGAERCIRWRELRDAAAELASRVRRSAAEPVLLVGSPNRIELLVAILGGLWADACVLPVSPELPALELAATARRARASLAIGEPAVLEALADCVAQRWPIDAVAAIGRAGPPFERAGAAGSLLLATSGTTGLPKLVRRDAHALDAVGANCARAIGIGPTDAMLMAIPAYHSYGIDQGVLTAVMAGCAIELHRRFDPVQVRSALMERGISVFPAVPVILDACARLARRPSRAPRLRRVYSAGSALARRVFDQFEQAWGVKIGQIYGATELGSVTFNDPAASSFDPEAAGHPMQGVGIRILDTHDPCVDRPLPPEVDGLVAVAAPSMLSGYVDDPRPATEGGFLLTGDLGRLDASGALRLSGRLTFLVDVGGIKVNPSEVESVLMRHPDVRDAVVLAIPFSKTTARLKAVVVSEPGRELSGEEIRRFARQHLIHYKVPRVFEIRTTMPRTATGKIVRKELERAMDASS